MSGSLVMSIYVKNSKRRIKIHTDNGPQPIKSSMSLGLSDPICMNERILLVVLMAILVEPYKQESIESLTHAAAYSE